MTAASAGLLTIARFERKPTTRSVARLLPSLPSDKLRLSKRKATDRTLRFIVGEQPGDKEDKMGKPFVGLADEILNEALNKADLTRLQPKGIVALGEALLEI